MTSNYFEAIFEVCMEWKFTGCLIEACMSAGFRAFRVLNEPESTQLDGLSGRRWNSRAILNFWVESIIKDSMEEQLCQIPKRDTKPAK